jgi:hypothetical protein
MMFGLLEWSVSAPTSTTASDAQRRSDTSEHVFDGNSMAHEVNKDSLSMAPGLAAQTPHSEKIRESPRENLHGRSSGGLLLGIPSAEQSFETTVGRHEDSDI